uniref:NADH dehydrogenase subunit 2 n=1 Tax=Taiwanaptera montana TaxID=3135762 RepID=UPI0031F3FC44
MMKNKLFILLMTMGTIITMSSNSWMGMWMGMEINMIAFMPLMKSTMMESSKSMMTYFLSQSMGSMIMLFSMMMTMNTMRPPSMVENIIKSMIMISMMIKMGIPPMHVWLVKTMESMNWNACLMLMTWQKMAPMSVMVQMNSVPIMSPMLMVATTMGAMGGINQTSMRSIMAYSSMIHTSWMMLLSKYSNKWMMYMLAYSTMTYMMCNLMNSEKIYMINQFTETSNTTKLMLTINMLSMGGMPPFLGFMPKWMTIQTVITTNDKMTLVFMTVMSLITLFYYMNSISPLIMKYSTLMKTKTPKTPKTFMAMITIMPMFLMLSLA